ncbi:unnamed protein product, partial [Mesorhabditis belari]|uniref:C2H2-type domain-containing protein n=1 Tax=Mesorhabditis belari TaxID=2138241 RepID=A0AAF3F200_9BILA
MGDVPVEFITDWVEPNFEEIVNPSQLAYADCATFDEEQPQTSYVFIDPETIDTNAYFEEHISSQPSTSHRKPATIVECEFCGIILKHPSKIQAHLRTHTGEKPFECEMCGQRFTQRTPWRNHVRTHYGDTPFTCSCGRSFASRSLKNAHELSHQGIRRKGPPQPHLKPRKKLIYVNEDSDAECLMDDNGEAFMIDRLDKRLMPQIFAEVMTPETTNINDAKTLRIESVINDVVNSVTFVPQTAKKVNQVARRCVTETKCEICGLQLRYPSKIQAHMRTHLGVKPYPCEKCDQRFTTPHSLKIHERRKHTNERPYLCTWECGLSFVSIADRNEHEKTVHVGVKRHKCVVIDCLRGFTRKKYLVEHIQRDHPMVQLNKIAMHPDEELVYIEALDGEFEEIVEEQCYDVPEYPHDDRIIYANGFSDGPPTLQPEIIFSNSSKHAQQLDQRPILLLDRRPINR